MYGSGVKTGSVTTVVVHRPTLRVLLVALTVWTVVAAGATARGAAACRFGSTARLRSPTTTSACALPSSSSQR